MMLSTWVNHPSMSVNLLHHAQKIKALIEITLEETSKIEDWVHEIHV